MTIRQQQLQLSRAELLKERRQALITAAVTGQFDVSTASGRNVTDGVSA
jgi:type I restriction enzyme S subunit